MKLLDCVRKINTPFSMVAPAVRERAGEEAEI
jgi:hypothetical protein